ncbi:MAG: hypothetical protein H6742_14305 [Alphaproteobacteria bacterium]|nr:hypothetical protein [Alphaproteobacteria bacterium]
MARYARVVSMETWNRQNGEDEAGFEGRRRRRRKQRNKRHGRGQGQRRQQRQARRSEDRGYPEEAPASRSRAQAQQGQQSPDFVYDEVPEDEDDPEPEGDFGAPFRRGARQGRQGGGRGLFGPREAGAQGQGRGLFPKGAGKRLREGLAPPWSPAIALGPNLKMKARKGFRAAVVEVKPGLFVVAEVPERSVEFGLGPLLLAPALVKTLGRAFRRGQAGQGQAGVQQQSASPAPQALPAPQPRAALPGPTADDDRLARWLDDDIAAELGCRACERRG